MSSRPIDEKIVKLTLENEDFERNAAQSLKTCGDINLTFNGMNNQKLDGLSGAVDQIAQRFTMLGTVVNKIREDIAEKLVDAGKKALMALGPKGWVDGYTEYELKLQNIQTIYNNLKDRGTTLGEISDQLDVLNEYADKTVYVFADMTSAIGKFSTQGLDLYTSVDAIKGLYNLAGYVGKQSSDATSAAQQLSYAIAGNKLSLLQWRSLQGTVGALPFQKALVETANAFGMLDMSFEAFQQEYGSMYNALNAKDGVTKDIGYNPFNTDVIVSALQLFSGELSQADLISMGFTKKQAQYWYEVGQSAIDASTKIRTFKKGIETIEESIGSGWAKSLEYIFGDYNEAGDLWTRIFDPIAKVTDAIGDARNTWLKLFAKGIGDYIPQTSYDGFTTLMKLYGFGNLKMSDFEQAAKEMGLKWNANIFKGLEANPGGFLDYTTYLGELITSQGGLNGIYSGISFIETMEDGKKYFELMGYEWDDTLAESLENRGIKVQDALKRMLWNQGIITSRDALIEGFSNIFSFVGEFFSPIKNLFQWLFPTLDGISTNNALTNFYLWSLKLKAFKWENTWSSWKNEFSTLFVVLEELFYNIRSGNLQAIIDGFKELIDLSFEKMLSKMGGLGQGLLNLKGIIGGFADFVVKNPLAWIISGIIAFAVIRNRYLRRNSDQDIAGGVVGLIQSISNFFSGWQEVAEAINHLSKSLKLIGIALLVMSFKQLAEGLKILSGIDIASAGKSLLIIAAAFGILVIGLKSLSKAISNVESIKLFNLALVIVAVGAGILMALSGLYALSKYDTKTIFAAIIIVMAAVKALNALMGAVEALDKISIAPVLLSLAVTIGTMAAAFVILGALPTSMFIKGLIALGVILGSIVGIFVLIKNNAAAIKLSGVDPVNVYSSVAKTLLSLAPLFLSIALSISIISANIEVLGHTNIDALMKGIGAIAIIMVGLTAVAVILTKLASTLDVFESSVSNTIGAKRTLGGALTFTTNGLKRKTLLGMIFGTKGANLESFFEYATKDPMTRTVTKARTKILELGASLLLTAFAIGRLSKAVAVLGKLDAMSLLQGLGSIALIMTGIYQTIKYLAALDTTSIKTKLDVGGIVFAITALSLVAAVIGRTDFISLAKGLGGIGGVMLELLGFFYAVGKFTEVQNGMDALSIVGTGNMLIKMGLGLIVFAGACALLSNIRLGDIGKGLLALGGGMAVVVLAAYGAQFAATGFIALGSTLQGLGHVLLGFGSILIGFGIFTAIVVYFQQFGDSLEELAIRTQKATNSVVVVIGTFFVEFLKGFKQYIPAILDELTKAVIVIAAAIIDDSKVIIDALVLAILGIVDALSDALYKYIPMALKLILKVILELVIGAIKGIGDLLVGLFPEAQSSFDKFMDKVNNWVIDNFNLNDSADTIKSEFTQLKERMSNEFAGLNSDGTLNTSGESWLRGLFPEGGASLKDLGKIGSTISSFGIGSTEGIDSAARELGVNFDKNIMQGITDGKNTFGDLASQATSGLKGADAVNKVKDIGKVLGFTITDQIAKGIEDGSVSVKDAVDQAVTNATKDATVEVEVDAKPADETKNDTKHILSLIPHDESSIIEADEFIGAIHETAEKIEKVDNKLTDNKTTENKNNMSWSERRRLQIEEALRNSLTGTIEDESAVREQYIQDSGKLNGSIEDVTYNLERLEAETNPEAIKKQREEINKSLNNPNIEQDVRTSFAKLFTGEAFKELFPKTNNTPKDEESYKKRLEQLLSYGSETRFDTNYNFESAKANPADYMYHEDPINEALANSQYKNPFENFRNKLTEAGVNVLADALDIFVETDNKMNEYQDRVKKLAQEGKSDGSEIRFDTNYNFESAKANPADYMYHEDPINEALANSQYKNPFENFRKQWDESGVKEVLETVGKFISGIVDSFKGLGGAVSDALVGKNSFIGKGIDLVGQWFTKGKNDAKDGGKGITKGLSDGMEVGITDSSKSIFSMFNKIKSTVSDGMGLKDQSYNKLGNKTVDQTATGVDRGMSKNSSTFTNAFSRVANYCRNTLSASNFSGIGSSIVDGLAIGIDTRINEKIKDTIVPAFNKVTTATRGTYSVRSPSRVFKEIGQYISDGLAIGIEMHSYKPVDSIESLGNATIEAMNAVNDELATMDNNDWIYSPVVTPIVDYDNITRLQEMLDNYQMDIGNIRTSQNGNNGDTMISGINVQVVINTTGKESPQDIAKIAREQAQAVITREVRKIIWK